ncbi:DNA-binding transcriptional repressor AcrR [Pseudovibrio axinellae]|uniref:DNA-binding transcriptional repressor AcrR n=1 Tax=Pseudovibrio axinellae TaxID=989403 RepID=A0A161V780_9HYPH|nr:TetR/AcrR family transcriptional regulator [Pseudovibrio axinellae]KZL20771.1 DNA-binding transcriptional repressor AcrR [Pseudovibrio axinellae]SER23098.1 transcriptional regulator, TetR family [Pseudovibrio axinellae]
MKTNFDKRKALGVFAQYGFRKTSVDDVANAVGLSRQSLYKKFGTKEELFQTIVEDYSIEVGIQALETLEKKKDAPKLRIVCALETLIGQHLDLMHNSAHGAQLLKLGEQVMLSGDKSLMPRVLHEIATVIAEGNQARSAEQAADEAFILFTLAKGLLLTVTNHAEYDAGIKRATDRLLH